jgi:hypothetical protein
MYIPYDRKGEDAHSYGWVDIQHIAFFEKRNQKFDSLTKHLRESQVRQTLAAECAHLGPVSSCRLILKYSIHR